MKPEFNQKSEINRDNAKKLPFTLTLAGRGDDTLQARAEDLVRAIKRWPMVKKSGDKLVSDVKSVVTETGGIQVTLQATETAMLDIQRQFSTHVQRVEPQPDVIPPAHRPKPVDPFDVRFW